MMVEVMWEERLAQGARQMVSSAIRDLLHVTEQPAMISFAGGLPAPECFPVEALSTAAQRVFADAPTLALQYGPTEGFSPLRSWLATHMASVGVRIPPDQVLITSGSQQGLDLIGKLFLDVGTPIVMEEPTYVGALQAWRSYQPHFLTVPLDEHGLDVERLAALFEHGPIPKFLYLVSSFQNPTGTTLALARREALLDLAEQHQFVIIEDDPYGDLYYEGERAQLLAALEFERYGELRHVIYLGTFSKLLAPGLRVGWMLAAPEILRRFVQAKQGLDLHTGSLAQAIIYEACSDGLLDRHLPVLRATYGARRDAMLQALQTHLATQVEWTRPSGGMFLWLTLAPDRDSTALLRSALERQVAFVPGSAFYAHGGGRNTLRLNFSHATPERITEGIARLADVIHSP